MTERGLVRCCRLTSWAKSYRFGEAWELRLGPDNMFRVFYRTDEETTQVRVLAIVTKIGARLYVGRKEFVP